MKNKKKLFYFLLAICLIYSFFNFFSESKINVKISEEKQSLSLNQNGFEEKEINHKKLGLVQLSNAKIETHSSKNFQEKRQPTALLADVVKNLTDDQLFQNTKWKIWSHVKAIKNDNLKSSDEVLAEVSHMSVIMDQQFIPDLTRFTSKELVVVYNERLKKAGFISGLIKVQTQNKEKLEEDLTQVRAHISEAFENIQTYYITGQDEVFNLQEIYLFLKSKNYIENVEIDIIDRSYEKN